VKIDYDPTKSEKNAAERGLSFEKARDFDWAGAVYAEDVRVEYPGATFRRNWISRLSAARDLLHTDRGRRSDHQLSQSE
jgi:uncharacterized DUF497 family protein